MQVIKRDGSRQKVRFEKIEARLRKLCEMAPPLDRSVDPTMVAQKVIQGLTDGIRTCDLDSLASETAVAKVTVHPDYGWLGSRIAVSDIHKQTDPSFYRSMCALHECVSERDGRPAPRISARFLANVRANADALDRAVRHERDYAYQYPAIKSLLRSTLLHIERRVAERPQYVLMRVAVSLHGADLPAVLESYEWMSLHAVTHASPTLFNAGTMCEQLSSCSLNVMRDDSIEGIYETLMQLAVQSKRGAGIGLSVHNVRGEGSYIRGSNGTSSGLVPMLRVFNETARYVDQGGGKRKGAFAIYLEPWHSDVQAFLELRKNQGKEEHRTRDLFTALWVPDLFMRRVRDGAEWSLFSPDEAPGLCDVWGAEFDAMYEGYEAAGRARQRVPARELFRAIVDAQIETGTPFVLYKDACNAKSNHKHLGTIRSSNLCTEIMQFSSVDEVAMCNLASVALPRFVRPPRGAPAGAVSDAGGSCGPPPSSSLPPSSGTDPSCVALPPAPPPPPAFPASAVTPSVPVGPDGEGTADGGDGVQDGTPRRPQRQQPESPSEDRLRRSMEALSRMEGASCWPTPAPSSVTAGWEFDHGMLFEAVRVLTRNLDRAIDVTACPLEQGRLSNSLHRPMGIGVQGMADMFNALRLPWDSPRARALNIEIFETVYYAALSASVDLAVEFGPHPSYEGSPVSRGILQFDMWGVTPSARWDWAALRVRIARHGVRNSLLVAQMPTASTALLMGNSEGCWPQSSNFVARRILAGDYVVINERLVRDMIELGIWSSETQQRILADGGSVQRVAAAPEWLRAAYRTSWEIPHRLILDMSADRAPFIDQSQSTSASMAAPTYEKVKAMHFYAWEKGLKTGMYYLRSLPAAAAAQVTVDPTLTAAVATSQSQSQSQQQQQQPLSSFFCSSAPSPSSEETAKTTAALNKGGAKGSAEQRQQQQQGAFRGASAVVDVAPRRAVACAPNCDSCSG